MFHAKVGRFNQFIAILVKRIWAKPMFKRFEHVLHVFAELLFGLRQVIGQYPII